VACVRLLLALVDVVAGLAVSVEAVVANAQLLFAVSVLTARDGARRPAATGHVPRGPTDSLISRRRRRRTAVARVASVTGAGRGRRGSGVASVVSRAREREDEPPRESRQRAEPKRQHRENGTRSGRNRGGNERSATRIGSTHLTVMKREELSSSMDAN
jgi:hypothetical protein